MMEWRTVDCSNKLWVIFRCLTPHPLLSSWIHASAPSLSMASIAYMHQDRFEEALSYFVRMHTEDFVLNEYSFGSALSACSGLKDIKMGTQIHALTSKTQFLSDVYMGSALVDMYGNCGSVSCAQRAFDDMTTAALQVFLRMMEFRIQLDELTLASVVRACVTLSAIKEGQQIHARVVKCDKIEDARCVFDGMQVRNVVSETSMVSGYAKAASVETARLMFTKMTERNIVSWNALIAGYTQNGEDEEALRLFCLLKRESICPTHYTFGNLLNVCANLADLQLGRQAHAHVLKHGFRFQFGEESDIFVGNSLIDMYMKCGSVEDDHVAMIGVLSACSHAGLVEEGRHHFSSMSVEYAKNLIETMPMKPDAVVWGSLLGACKIHRDISLGKYVAEKLLEIDPSNSGPYVLLSNMYAELGRWGDVVKEEVDEEMRSDQATSWIISSVSDFDQNDTATRHGQIMQVIEISKGSKVKYELDKKNGLIKVDRVLSAISCLSSQLLFQGLNIEASGNVLAGRQQEDVSGFLY
ncbi:hypothetical protein COLO4_29207 [Corchorus olitorius]|uniref:Pentatricopeptide repeat-containing protein n=1 Tax=Corchorus olitorius TaxID=93759 RepID=A0A1R3HFS3_9ROSI|nr:hypothetical protein COLO4_29207 [Corchorus olitorius]